MADPVTFAMVGAAAGVALKPNDPLKGAMLGATAGYTGGTALGIGGAAGAAGGASAAGGAAAGTTAATNSALASQIAAERTASYAGGNILNAANAASTANNAKLAAMNASGMSFSGRPPVDPTMLNVSAAPSFMDKLGMSGKNAIENPIMASQALGATNSLLASDQPPQSAPVMPVQARNKLGAYDPIALLDPYRPSVIGGQQNQPISLI